MENPPQFEGNGSQARNDCNIEMQNLNRQESDVNKGRWRALFDKYSKPNEEGEMVVSTTQFAEDLKKESFNKTVPKHVVRKIVARADKDRDGYISYTEFVDMVRTRDGYQLLTGWIQQYVNYTVPPRVQRPRYDDSDATDGPYEDEYSCCPPPICMLIISIIELGAFIYDYTITGNFDSVNGPSATLFMYDPYRRVECWRFLTYMFVHLGVFHLGVNLIVQIALGIPLEMVHGWWRILLIYLAGVMAGSLLTSIYDPRVFLVGASGGVYALITAHLATLILNWKEMQCALIQLIVFIIVVGSDVGSNLYNHYVLKINTQVGHAAHLGGAIAGLLVGLYILRNLEVHSWEKKVCWVALSIYVILTVAAIAVHIFVSDYFPARISM